jgi:hypothetical protein
MWRSHATRKSTSGSSPGLAGCQPRSFLPSPGAGRTPRHAGSDEALAPRPPRALLDNLLRGPLGLDDEFMPRDQFGLVFARLRADPIGLSPGLGQHVLCPLIRTWSLRGAFSRCRRDGPAFRSVRGRPWALPALYVRVTSRCNGLHGIAAAGSRRHAGAPTRSSEGEVRWCTGGSPRFRHARGGV